MTEKRRLATAAAAMRQRMMTLSRVLVFSDVTTAGGKWVWAVMAAEGESTIAKPGWRLMEVETQNRCAS